MAKEKTLEIILKARDETERATRESAENIRNLQQQWSGLDKSIRKAQAAKQRRRDQADDTLQRQQIRLLEREAEAGNKAAGVELRRTRITQEFAREKLELQKIINSERTSDRQKIAAQRQLATLDQQRARALEQVNKRQRRGNALIGTMTTRLAGLAAGGAAVGLITRNFENLGRELQAASREVAKFEAEMTELLSLGGNLQNLDAIKNQVVGLSNALGTSRQEIARTLFDLQSGTANLDQTVRDELLRSAVELNQVYGGELPTSLRNMVKVFQIFGESASDAATIQRRLAFTAEQGFLTFEEMAQQLPDVASAADAMGASLNEVLASLIVATQRGGKTEKTFTGVRNVFLRMSKAQKEGITLTGDFTDRLRQLNAAAENNPELLKKVFGDEALAAANNMLSAVDDIDSAIGKLSGRLPDLGDKLATRFEDAAFAVSEINKSLQQLEQNALLNASPQAQRLASGFNASQAGMAMARVENPRLTAARGLNPFDQFGERVNVVFDSIIGGDLGREALIQAFRDAMSAGRLNLAEQLVVRLEDTGAGAPGGGDALRGNIARARIEAGQFGQAERIIGDLGDSADARNLQRILEAERQAAANRRSVERRRQREAAADEADRRSGEADRQRIADRRESIQQILRDQRAEFEARQEAARTAQLEAQTRLRALNRDLLREEAKAGDEAAEQELRRLKLAEQLTERREQLQQIITDADLSDDTRDRARELLERAEDAARNARTAGAAALRAGDAGEQPDAGGSAIAAIGRREARFLAFQNGSVGEAPEAKTARNTERMAREQERTRRAIQLLADFMRENDRAPFNFIGFNP
jgi:TP901 family phage tail tape measure protein